MNSNRLKFASIVTGAILMTSVGGAVAQQDTPNQMMHKDGHATHSQTRGKNQGSGVPTLPGQDAFGAIQEIVAILEADSSTDWSRVNISALRAHLTDMNRLVMDTDVRKKTIAGGLEITITGQGRALPAIQAMVPAHAPMIDGLNEWTAKAELTATGAKLTITGADAKEAAHIRGLGFYGLMVSGSHHQAHHLGLARGESVHSQ